MISLRRYTNENQQNLSAQVPTRVDGSTKSATFHDNLCIYAPPSPTRIHLPPRTNKLETALPIPKNFKLPQVCESPPLTTLRLEAKPGKCDSYESYTKRYST